MEKTIQRKQTGWAVLNSKLERTKYLHGLSEGCKKGFVEGIVKAKKEIGQRLIAETNLSLDQISEVIGYDLKINGEVAW